MDHGHPAHYQGVGRYERGVELSCGELPGKEGNGRRAFVEADLVDGGQQCKFIAPIQLYFSYSSTFQQRQVSIPHLRKGKDIADAFMTGF